MAADTRGMTATVKEYMFDVVLALIDRQGLDAFQAVGLTSIHSEVVQRGFDDRLSPISCSLELMPLYHAGQKKS